MNAEAIRYFIIGLVIGAVAAWYRLKSSPTAHTAQTPGFKAA
jgi:hypothetical protein